MPIVTWLHHSLMWVEMNSEKDFIARRYIFVFFVDFHFSPVYVRSFLFCFGFIFFSCPQPPAHHVSKHLTNTNALSHTYNDIREWSSNLWWRKRKHSSHIAAESLNKAPCISQPIRPLLCSGQSRSGASSPRWGHLTCLLSSQDLSGGRGLWNAVDIRAACSADYTHTHTYTQRSFVLPSSWFTCVKCHTKAGIAWNGTAWRGVLSEPAHTLVMKIFLVARFPLQMVCSPGRQITADCLNSDRLSVFVCQCVFVPNCADLSVCVLDRLIASLSRLVCVCPRSPVHLCAFCI